MGKRDKRVKHKQQRNNKGASYYYADEGEYEDTNLNDRPSSSLTDDDPQQREAEDLSDAGEDETEKDSNPSMELLPSKFHLYQQSVQSPKGDISYMQKFFLIYVGGRQPLHLQEDFCGTALLSTEWLHSDPRRTAIGLDFDLEALEWCLENNTSKIGADMHSRITLFHGNVLNPLDAKLVKYKTQDLMQKICLEDSNDSSEDADKELDSVNSTVDRCLKRNCELPARDIVCAFNYSCCCLHKRSELVSYFKHVRNSLSKKGGIFVMDLYGGTSAEGKLRLQRKFPNFNYVWEQAEFDIIERKTRISLHFHLLKQQKKIRHAFSYSWRLWSLPEIKDCLEEAGFKSVHFWMREMPDAAEMRSTEGFGAARDVKYEEVKTFQQIDAWNAYIVAVLN